MKRRNQWIILIAIMTGLMGCSIAGGKTESEIPPEKSEFKAAFSIGEIVEAHKDLLSEGSRTLSGMEAGTREPFIQSQETMTIQVEQDNTEGLLKAIQADIQEALTASGAEILGGGSDFQPNSVAYFFHDYRDGEFSGTINIWGIRGEGNQFILISQITESKKTDR